MAEAITAPGSSVERMRARLELAKVLDLLDRREEALAHYTAVANQAERASDRDEAARYRKQPYREGPPMVARQPGAPSSHLARP